MNTHTRVSPSALNRAVACPIHVLLPRWSPPIKSGFTSEGTLAHSHFEEVLKCRNDINDLEPFIIEGKVPDKFRNAIQDAILYVKTLVADVKNYKIYVEKTFDMDFLVTGMKGTADLIIHDFENHKIHICDFKYGEGIKVSATRNLQLLMYAMGYINSIEDLDTFTIYLHIIQPRINNYDLYEVSQDDIGYIFNVCRELNYNIASGNRHHSVGDHCSFCPAILHCPAVKRGVKKVINSDTDEIFEDISSLEKIYGHKPIIDKFFETAKVYLQSEVREGRELEHLKPYVRNLPRKWKNGAVQKLLNLPNGKNFVKVVPRNLPELKSEVSIDLLNDLLEPAEQTISFKFKDKRLEGTI